MTPSVVRQDLADMATQQDTVTFLAKCETGLIPDEAPKQKVGSSSMVMSSSPVTTLLQERGPIEHKEIVVPAGWGPG